MTTRNDARLLFMEALQLDPENIESFIRQKLEQSVVPKKNFIQVLDNAWKWYDKLCNDPRLVSGYYRKQFIKDGLRGIPIHPEYVGKEGLSRLRPIILTLLKEVNKQDNYIKFNNNGQTVTISFEYGDLPEWLRPSITEWFLPKRITHAELREWKKEFEEYLDSTPKRYIKLFVEKSMNWAKINLDFYTDYQPHQLQLIAGLERRLAIVYKLIETRQDISSDYFIKSKSVFKEAPAKNKKTQICIALYHFFIGKPITLENSQHIAESYGYRKPNSGHSLWQEFTIWSSERDRLAENGNPTLKTKIKHFETLVNWLNEDGKQKAAKLAMIELQTLRDKLTKKLTKSK